MRQKSWGLKWESRFLKKTEKTHNVKTYSTNVALYGDMSNRVMSILCQESLKIEIYSIDEAFIALKGIKEKDTQGFLFDKTNREKLMTAID